MSNLAFTQILGRFRGNEMVAAAGATRVTQITPELEREGGLAMETHGDAPQSIFFDARSPVWRGRDRKVKV